MYFKWSELLEFIWPVALAPSADSESPFSLSRAFEDAARAARRKVLEKLSLLAAPAAATEESAM